MTTETVTIGIRPEAMPAWLALSASLDALADQGRQPVCRHNPEQWGSDVKPRVRREAAEACQSCPILGACQRFADAADERFGVWAGIDRTNLARDRRKEA